jgi:hypothetical protein
VSFDGLHVYLVQQFLSAEVVGRFVLFVPGALMYLFSILTPMAGFRTHSVPFYICQIVPLP